MSKLASSNGRSSAGARRTVGQRGLVARLPLQPAQHRRLRLGDRERLDLARRSGRGSRRCHRRSRGPRRRPRRSVRCADREPGFLGPPDIRSYVAAKNLLRRLMQRGSDDARRAPGAIAPSFSRQTVLVGEEARADARGDVGLRVDVLDVVARRLRRDHESAGDLLARQAARDQPQDVDLAGVSPAGPLASPPTDGRPRRALRPPRRRRACPPRRRLAARWQPAPAPAAADGDAARSSTGTRRPRRGGAPAG